MQDLGPDAFPRHLSGLLFDDARAHHWVTAVHDGARARALSPSDALTLGVLLARSSTTGRGETARAAEAALEPGLKDSVAERPYQSNLCTSGFHQNSVRIQQNYHSFSEILTILGLLNIF